MSVIHKIKKFVEIEKAEVRRVTWPSKKELLSHSILILILSIILSAIFALFDLGFNTLIRFLITKVL